LTGDRTGDLSALRGRSWDAVLDTFTDTAPGAPAVRAVAEILTGSVGVYGYVSGMSVYAPTGPARPDESAPVRRAGREPDDDPLQERSLAKLAAESVLAEVFDGPVLLPRVGIMVGPRDPSHRFTWWPLRLHRALRDEVPRTVPAPGDPSRTVQYSDARDIARWIVEMLERGQGGTYNTVGPDRADRLDEVVHACLAAAGGVAGDVAGDVEFRWTPEEQLRDLLVGVEEERRPLWFPENQIPQTAIDSTAAFAAGLTFRPVAETARDTLEWALREGADGLVDGPFERRVAGPVRTAPPDRDEGAGDRRS
jgi:2'-hydroxyisoflavone reductase